MYECNNCNTCGVLGIPDPGGLAWSNAGIGAIECTTTSGNPVYCDKDAQACRYGIPPDYLDIYEQYSGVLESKR